MLDSLIAKADIWDMSTPIFDKMTYIDTLKAGGVDERQARAQAAALEVALRDSVATSSELKETKNALQQQIAETTNELKREIADTANELRKEIAETTGELRKEIADVKVGLEKEIADVEHSVALLRKDMEGMENRMTVRLGGLIVLATGVLAVLMKIL